MELTLYAAKLPCGGVTITKPDGTFVCRMMNHFMGKPNRTHKYITINCYRYALAWR